MFVDITVNDIKVMGLPKTAVFYLACQPELGNSFDIQYTAMLSEFKGKSPSEARNQILAELRDILRVTIEAEAELDENKEWRLKAEVIDKGFRLDLGE